MQFGLRRMMTDAYHTTVLEEAEQVAERHDQVARTTDNQAHEYLRYAVFRVLGGESEHLPADWTRIDGVTVGYVSDDVMAALGVWRVWAGSAAACGSYDHRERREVHYVWPEGHPVEELLHERLSGPSEAVAPDGGRTGDVRDRLVVDENAQSKDDLEPRTMRAVAEAMDVSLLSKGGCYEVQSASGNRHEIDAIDEPCTCPDWLQRSPEGGCKHLCRVDHEVKRGRVPRREG